MERIFDKEGIGMLIEWMLSKIGAIISRDLPNLTAGKATKLATARTISLSGGASGSVSFDGSANRTLNVTDLKESFMSYGGADLFNAITPIDGAAMGELWCNKLAYYNTDYIQVEYTNNYSEDEDGNESSDVVWTEYPFASDFSRKSSLTRLVTDYADVNLYSSGSASINTAIAGKTRLRVTLLPYTARYLVCQKLIVKVGACGTALNNQLKIESVTKTDYDNGDVDKFTHLKTVKVVGDVGFSSINLGGRSFGTSTYAERRKMRFTLIVNNVDSTARPPVLHHIYILGRHYNAADSRFASHGVPYGYDEEQRTIWYKPLYPNANGATDLGLTTKYWNNVYGKKFITSGGTKQQVLLGDGSLKSLSEIGKTYSVVTTSADGLMPKGMYAALKDGFITNIVNVTTTESNVELTYDAAYPNADGSFNIAEGEGVEIPLATTTKAGVMSAEDKVLLGTHTTKIASAENNINELTTRVAALENNPDDNTDSRYTQFLDILNNSDAAPIIPSENFFNYATWADSPEDNEATLDFRNEDAKTLFYDGEKWVEGGMSAAALHIPYANSSTSGLMSAADKIKLDGFDGFNTAKDYVGADVADGVYGRNNYIDLSGKGLNVGDIIIVTHKNGSYVAYAMLIWADGGMLEIKSESTPSTTISTESAYIVFSSVQSTDEITIRKIHTTRL